MHWWCLAQVSRQRWDSMSLWVNSSTEPYHFYPSSPLYPRRQGYKHSGHTHMLENGYPIWSYDVMLETASFSRRMCFFLILSPSVKILETEILLKTILYTEHLCDRMWGFKGDTAWDYASFNNFCHSWSWHHCRGGLWAPGLASCHDGTVHNDVAPKTDWTQTSSFPHYWAPKNFRCLP